MKCRRVLVDKHRSTLWRSAILWRTVQDSDSLPRRSDIWLGTYSKYLLYHLHKKPFWMCKSRWTCNTLMGKKPSCSRWDCHNFPHSTDHVPYLWRRSLCWPQHSSHPSGLLPHHFCPTFLHFPIFTPFGSWICTNAAWNLCIGLSSHTCYEDPNGKGNYVIIVHCGLWKIRSSNDTSLDWKRHTTKTYILGSSLVLICPRMRKRINQIHAWQESQDTSPCRHFPQTKPDLKELHLSGCIFLWVLPEFMTV